MHLGIKIKKIRQLRDYKQSYMADMLNIEQNTYSKIENGKTSLTVDRLDAIAEILGVSRDFIENFDANKFIKNANLSISVNTLENFVKA